MQNLCPQRNHFAIQLRGRQAGAKGHMAAMQRRCAAHGVIAGWALLQHMPQWLVAILAIGQPPQLFAVLRLDAGRVGGGVGQPPVHAAEPATVGMTQPAHLQRRGRRANTASRLPG